MDLLQDGTNINLKMWIGIELIPSSLLFAPYHQLSVNVTEIIPKSSSD